MTDYAAEQRRFDHAKKKDAAASAMLAALVQIRDRTRGSPATLRGDVDAMARAAIAQAEAAGIGKE